MQATQYITDEELILWLIHNYIFKQATLSLST
jgi:hypothetical protein